MAPVPPELFTPARPQLPAFPALLGLPTGTPGAALVHAAPHRCSDLLPTRMPRGPCGVAWHALPSWKMEVASGSLCRQLVTPLPGKSQVLVVLEPGLKKAAGVFKARGRGRDSSGSVPDPRRGLTCWDVLTEVAPRHCQSVPGPAHPRGTAISSRTGLRAPLKVCPPKHMIV